MTYRTKWEALENKEVKKQFASSVSSKFRQLPDVSEDIEKEWLLFRSTIISSAAESCNVQTTEGYHSLVCQGKYMPNALKGNAEK